jgi:DNA helicase-2/ATP-dependent DNA helicase PcrA
MPATETKSRFPSLLKRAKEGDLHMPGRPISEYQAAVYQWIVEGTGNLIVNAVAGSGKTTTILDSLFFIPKTLDVVIVAFNKLIANHLVSKGLPSHATASTLHSLGLQTIKRTMNVRVDVDKLTKILKGHFNLDDKNERNLYFKNSYAITRTVSLLKSNLMEPTAENIKYILLEYDMAEVLQFVTLIQDVYMQSVENTETIDFDDMLFFPVHFNLGFTAFDFIFVDESQDLNPGQAEFIRRMATDEDGDFRSRVVIVGDRNQAIYAWRGADANSMDKLKETFQAHELPLSISWRCPTRVIDLAKTIVPHIEAAPNAAEGTHQTIDVIEFEEILCELEPDECLTVCRTNAPLIRICLRLIRSGVPATVLGRMDVGKGITKQFKTLLEKFDRANPDLEDYNFLPTWITVERDAQVAKLMAPEFYNRRIHAQDMHDTINYFLEDLDLGDTRDLAGRFQKKLDQVFSEDRKAYKLSTIHKAKGLEAKNIFFYLPENVPHPMARGAKALEQEHNLRYVAITRSLDSLFFVSIGPEAA